MASLRRGRVLVKNWHEFERKAEVAVEETRYVESDARLMQRLLGREIGGKQNILVLNDEAHHAYRIRQAAACTAEEGAQATNEELEDELAYESTIWIDALTRDCERLIRTVGAELHRNNY
jgi:hypothetical protein